MKRGIQLVVPEAPVPEAAALTAELKRA